MPQQEQPLNRTRTLYVAYIATNTYHEDALFVKVPVNISLSEQSDLIMQAARDDVGQVIGSNPAIDFTIVDEWVNYGPKEEGTR